MTEPGQAIQTDGCPSEALAAKLSVLLGEPVSVDVALEAARSLTGFVELLAELDAAA